MTRPLDKGTDTPWAPLLARVQNDASAWASCLNAGMQAAGVNSSDLDAITDEQLAAVLAAAHAYLDAHPPRDKRDIRTRNL